MRELLSFPRNIYQGWLWLLMLSFSYERPILIVSSMDRINPRFFDVVLLVGVALFSISKTRAKKNPVFMRWAMIVLWFVFCVVLGGLFFDFPLNIIEYMFFFLFRYLKGLVAIYLVLKIPNDKISINDFVVPLIWGGLFVAVYCVYEMAFEIDQVVLTETLSINKPPLTVWGPFSGSYFHIAVYVPLIASICFSKFLTAHNKDRYFWFFLTAFVAWPIFFSGSRTGIALIFLSFLLIVWYTRKNIKNVIFIVVAMSASFYSMQKYVITEDNYTYQRAVNMASAHEHNSILSRVTLFSKFDINEYDKSDWLPFIGAGFYVAPVNDERFRIGYGFHNIFLFIFEQSGVVGLFLFFAFIVFCIMTLRRYLVKSKWRGDSDIRWVVMASYSYFVACLVIGVSGHTFWYGFNTGEFQTLRVLMLVICVSYISSYKNGKVSL